MCRATKSCSHKGSWRNLARSKRKSLLKKRRELDKAKLRVREIDGVIQKLYEDNATGKISDERFATMSMSLENEQSELKDRIPALENELENAKIKTEGLQRFIDKANRLPVPTLSRPNWYTNLLKNRGICTRIQRRQALSES